MSEIMGFNIEEAIESKLDRSKWITWKFSDLFENIVEKVVPKDSGLEQYIGLEHLDSGSLHIKRFGDTASLIGDKLKIFKGDIIFAKRNAYLKRASIAPFDAVASAHSLVLRPKPKNVLPEFIPFFLMSEKFWQRAIEISVGSLSPTINWKVLAKQEFLLPPKEEQAKLAELLWAMDEVIEREKEVLDNINELRKSQLNETYNSIPNRLKSSRSSLEKIVKLSSGKTRPKDLAESITGDYKYPVYGGNGIIGYSKDYLIDYNTIVLGRVGEYCGVVHDSEGMVWISDNALYIKEFLIDFNMYYLSRYLEYIDLNKQQNKSSHPLITQSKVCSNTIPLLTQNQIKIQNIKLKSIEDAMKILTDKLSSSQSLQKSLINQVFSSSVNTAVDK